MTCRKEMRYAYVGKRSEKQERDRWSERPQEREKKRKSDG